MQPYFSQCEIIKLHTLTGDKLCAVWMFLLIRAHASAFNTILLNQESPMATPHANLKSHEMLLNFFEHCCTEHRWQLTLLTANADGPHYLAVKSHHKGSCSAVKPDTYVCVPWVSEKTLFTLSHNAFSSSSNLCIQEIAVHVFTANLTAQLFFFFFSSQVQEMPNNIHLFCRLKQLEIMLFPFTISTPFDIGGITCGIKSWNMVGPSKSYTNGVLTWNNSTLSWNRSLLRNNPFTSKFWSFFGGEEGSLFCCILLHYSYRCLAFSGVLLLLWAHRGLDVLFWLSL